MIEKEFPNKIPKKDSTELKQHPEFLKWLYNVLEEREKEMEASVKAIREMKLDLEKLLEG